MSFYENQVDPIGVHDAGSLFSVLTHQVDCIQYIRELVVNMIEAGASKGRITVDLEHYRNTGTIKLCFMDNGCGMTRTELVDYINNIAAGRKDRGQGKNYGAGAKMSTAKFNPAGMNYRSWVIDDPDGGEIIFAVDPVTGEYGLRRFEAEGEDGQLEITNSWYPDGKPAFLRKESSGTYIRLDGISDEHNTAEAPEGVRGGVHWIHVVLNYRFFRFPKDFHLSAVRFGTSDTSRWGEAGVAHNDVVHGAKHFLDKESERHGVLDVYPKDAPNAKIHWWLFPEGFNSSGGGDSRNPLTRHFAFLHEDEIYERNTSLAQMREFGFSSISSRVAIYIEPEDCEPDVGRTYLRTLGGTRLIEYLEDYQTEFYTNLPDELRKADENAVHSRVTKITPDDIKKYLKKQREDLPFAPHLSRSSSGQLANLGNTSRSTGGSRGTGTGTGGGGGVGSGSGSTGRSGPVGGPVDPTKKRVRVKRREAVQEKPIVVKLTNETENEDLAGYAASFTVTNNQILVNQDYYLYGRIYERAKSARSTDEVIKAQIESYVGLRIATAVSAARNLKSTGLWTESQFKQGVESSALTTAVELARLDILTDVKRSLGAKHGKARAAKK